MYLRLVREVLAADSKGLVADSNAGAVSATKLGSSRVALKRQPKHLVLISVESLSADFLGVYGSRGADAEA